MITLDSIYFQPGSRVQCAARAVNADGSEGLELMSPIVTISREEGSTWQSSHHVRWNTEKCYICLISSYSFLQMPHVFCDTLIILNDKVKVLVTQLCLTLCNPMDCSPLGSSVHGIFQARILEQVTIPFSRGSSQPGTRTLVSCIAGGYFTI